MKNFFSGLGIASIIVWCLWSCEKNGTYSNVPEVRFKGLSFDSTTSELGIDLMANLTFSFIDGDGDIGVRPQDTARKDGRISKIHYMWYYKKIDGGYEPYSFGKEEAVADSTEIPYNSVMDKEEAQNKVLKGSIVTKLFAPYKPQGIDTMRIEFYITDRAKHKSNVDHTPDFSILNTSVEIK